MAITPHPPRPPEASLGDGVESSVHAASQGVRRAKYGVNVADLAGLQDERRGGGDVRFVEEFFRSWESQGDRRFKQTVDRQTSYGVFASYGIGLDDFRLTINFEILNLTNSNLFDVFGVQNPPRTFFLKVTGQFQPPAEQAPPVPLR